VNVKIVITDHRFPEVAQERRAVEASGGKLVVAQMAGEQELAELCKDADGVLTVRAAITKRVIAAMDRCRIIVRYGIGVDTIDIPAATERGIMVANVPDYCIDEVSDHALALLLMLSRQMIPAMSLAREEHWAVPKMPPVHRLRGQICGLGGCGKIGSLLAGKVSQLGMRVLIYDPYLSQSRCCEMGAEMVSFDALLARSDFVSLHAPLNDETHHLFGETAFAKMKSAASVINTSRRARFGENFRRRSRCDGIGNGSHAGARWAHESLQSDYDPSYGLAQRGSSRDAASRRDRPGARLPQR
jgi:D-3-phosphoglycerate dehydrogenase